MFSDGDFTHLMAIYERVLNKEISIFYEKI